ncbi:MAG TPA: low temperature requirement protein A [Gammaproteobacteria bacterium]
MIQSAPTLLRRHDGIDGGRVTPVELFFDLVFVFAVTQLSHALLAQPIPLRAAQVSLLLIAVWGVWIYTSWVTNWLDPERIPVRLCLFALMLAGVVLAASIPEAFAERGSAFAGAYVFMQVGRTLFFLWAARRAPVRMIRNFQRILAWLVVSGLFWIAGGFSREETRFAWWAAALLLEYISPWLYFWVPGLGRSSIADWNIHGGHMAERCALFVIIALGESLLVTGATFAELAWSAETLGGLTIAVLSSMAMWWIYFDTGAPRAQHRIEREADPGRQGRMAYTYLHLLIVGGIIVSAVADELVLVHPDQITDAGIAAIIGAPALYLLGNALFKWVTNVRRAPPLSHVVGLLLFLPLLPSAFAHRFSALMLNAIALGILIVVTGWESIAIRKPLAPASANRR